MPRLKNTKPQRKKESTSQALARLRSVSVQPSPLPANLPSIAHAKLPATYANARTALERCTRIDECKDWADKAEALASYGRQSEDKELYNMAERIRARAIRRCGELLGEIAPRDTPGRPSKNGGGGSPITRAGAARDAGLSVDQRKTALRVANVPGSEFEAAVESDNPPTVSALAEQGKKPRPLIDLEGRDPKLFALSTEAQGQIKAFGRMIERVFPNTVIEGAFEEEIIDMMTTARAIMEWLDMLFLCVQKKGVTDDKRTGRTDGRDSIAN